MTERETEYARGEQVWVRKPEGIWERGIVTDVFLGVSGEVVVVGGDGFYTEDVVHDAPGEETP